MKMQAEEEKNVFRSPPKARGEHIGRCGRTVICCVNGLAFRPFRPAGQTASAASRLMHGGAIPVRRRFPVRFCKSSLPRGESECGRRNMRLCWVFASMCAAESARNALHGRCERGSEPCGDEKRARSLRNPPARRADPRPGSCDPHGSREPESKIESEEANRGRSRYLHVFFGRMRSAARKGRRTADIAAGRSGKRIRGSNPLRTAPKLERGLNRDSPVRDRSVYERCRRSVGHSDR